VSPLATADSWWLSEIMVGYLIVVALEGIIAEVVLYGVRLDLSLYRALESAHDGYYSY